MQNTGALEEAQLTETPNDPQPEPEEAQPEQEVTALIPTEPDVIEGEFVEISPPEDTTPPKQKPYWVLIPFMMCLCVMFIAVTLLLPVFTPSATVILLPVEKPISLTTTMQVQGRPLPALTLAQSQTNQVTGKRHRNATRAYGTITFYNGLLSSQTIAIGTVLTGADGVQIITDQAAIIPAGNPPVYGQVTVVAHAILAGPQGNIQVFDINTACCAASVVAKNTRSFTGGSTARDFSLVTRTDITNAVTSLLVMLRQSEDAALQAQLRSDEELIAPSCKSSVSSDHKPGDEAKQLTVTVSVTCLGIAYAAHRVEATATQLLTADAVSKLGTNYVPLGDIQVLVVHGEVLSQRQGGVSVDVQIAGIWAYQITPNIHHRLLRLIAGMSKQQAIATLLAFPGIAGVQITLRGGNQMLPQDPRGIRIIVQYRAF